MYDFLTKEDKIDVINSRISANERYLYTFEINKAEALLEDPVDEDRVKFCENEILSSQKKIEMLKKERSNL